VTSPLLRRCKESEYNYVDWIVAANGVLFRAAETHGGRYVQEFCCQMWKQLGMRVLVLSAHHDTNGTLSLAT
jgi:hypothetical protein